MKKKLNLYFVLGGAVSAGAYTAGVLDYFMLRLKEYMAQDEQNREYDIQIKAIAGTSAGGMCGSIFLHSLVQGYPHSPENSELFKTWVEDIDISVLSEMDDIKKGTAPNALLNGNAIKKIANNVFDKIPSNENVESYNFLANDCKLILSVTDTLGQSYTIDFVNDSSEKPYFITNHRDYYKFTLTNPSTEFIELKNKQDWEILKNASIATGAFPVGLPPVKLKRPSSAYNDEILGKPFNVGSNVHKYYGIDGGIGDNEPFGQLIDIIEKDEEGGSESAIILIDPFPSANKKQEGDSIGVQLKRLYAVFRNQSAYKPKEIKEFKNKGFKCYSIIPKSSSDPNVESHLAGAQIGAFSGFIHQNYRYFDYQLGLRNCQKFLLSTFHFFKNLPSQEEILAPEWPSIGIKEYKSKTKALDKRINKILKASFKPLLINLVNFFFKKKVSPSNIILRELEKQKMVVK